MLAVFERSVSRPPPEFVIHSGWQVPANWLEAAELYTSSFPDAILYNFSKGNFMALTHANEDPVLPRSVASMDDIFCIFVGNLENIVDLRRHYGLTRHATEPMLMIEVYKVLRDRAPYPPDQVIKDLVGNFAFILFDVKAGNLFTARDRDEVTRFHWGMLDDGSLAISDDSEVILDLCGQSSTHFPPGCLYQNTNGLMSFVHPLHKVMPVVHRDLEGDPCSIYFEVDLLTRLPRIPRVGSGENWSDATTAPSGRSAL